MKYDETNVTLGVKEDGENPGYYYAPCMKCGKRINVGNYPPIIVDGKLDIYCVPSCVPSAREVLHSVLHEAVHQQMEDRGIPTLADECIPLLTTVMMLIRRADMSTAQILAVMDFTTSEMRGMACEKCKDLSTRISAHMSEDFRKFIKKNAH